MYEYVAGARRLLCRQTRSHATVRVGGAEQAEIWSAHRVGGRPRVGLDTVLPQRRAEAHCVGFATAGTTHRRVFEIAEGALHVRDTIEGRAGSLCFALPLAIGLDVSIDSVDAAHPVARVALRGGDVLRIALPSRVRWRAERGPAYPEFGREAERVVLMGESEETGSFDWRFELA